MVALQPKRENTKLATILTGRLSFLGIGQLTLVGMQARVQVLKPIVLSVWCVLFVNTTENQATEQLRCVDGVTVHSLKKGMLQRHQESDTHR